MSIPKNINFEQLESRELLAPVHLTIDVPNISSVEKFAIHWGTCKLLGGNGALCAAAALIDVNAHLETPWAALTNGAAIMATKVF